MRARNIVLLLLLAAAVWRLPGGAEGGAVVANLISLLFWGGLIFFAYRLYMERRTSIMGWEDRLRLRFYASIGLLAFLVVGLVGLFAMGSTGALLWFVLLGVAIWGVFTSIRAARSY